MNDINHWALDAYRNLKLYSPATGDFLTWLEANAVKMPLEGTWVFNAAPNLPSSEIDISPISSSTDISILEPDYDTANGPLLLIGINVSESSIGFYTYLDGDEHLYQAYSNGVWEDNSMRAITFTEPVQYEGNEEFIRWFVDNATPKPELSGTYLFNAELTVPILSDGRPLVDGTNDALSVGASPIFITTSAFECGGVSYESMGFQNNRLESKGTPHFTFIYSPVSGNDSRVYNPTIDQDDGWSDESYRTVTFTTPFPRSSNTWFYDWFIQNTTKQS